MNQVPYAPYVLSKALWTIGICALQSLAFSVMLCISARIPIPLAASVESPSLDMSVLWFGPLYVSCLMGAFCGLAVSSVARKQLGAISVVPNIAILALAMQWFGLKTTMITMHRLQRRLQQPSCHVIGPRRSWMRSKAAEAMALRLFACFRYLQFTRLWRS